MKIMTFRLGDVAMGHLTEEDAKKLPQLQGFVALATGPMITFEANLLKGNKEALLAKATGSFMAVDGTPEVFQEMHRGWKRDGMSKSFLAIMRACHKQGIEYVRFDADSLTIPGEKLYDW